MKVLKLLTLATLVSFVAASCSSNKRQSTGDPGATGGSGGTGGEDASTTRVETSTSTGSGASGGTGGSGGSGGTAGAPSGGGSGGSGASGGSGGSGGDVGAAGEAGAAGAAGAPPEGTPQRCLTVEPTDVDLNCEAVGEAVGRYYARCNVDYMEFGWGREQDTADYHEALCERQLGLEGVESTIEDWAAWAGHLDAMDCDCTLFFEAPRILNYGTLEDGAPCLVGGQCDSGACNAGWTTCGTCQPTKTLGEACTLGECGLGLRCNASSGTCELPRDLGEDCAAHHDCIGYLACYDGVCSMPLELGEPCAGQSFNECIIMDGVCSSGTCEPRNAPAPGENCLGGWMCQGHAYCNRTDEPVENWLCEPRGDVGDPCTMPEYLGASGTCLNHLVCDVGDSDECIEPEYPVCE